MQEVFEKIKERLLSTNVDGRCPELSCWEHSSKDCNKCDLIEIKIRDAIEIVNQVAEEYKTVCNSNRLNDGWIPVSSGKLPKKGQVVNATILIESQQRRFVTQVMYGSWWLNSDKRMIAWKPLEEPYEGE